MLGVGSKEVEGLDSEVEDAGLCELAKAGAQRDEVVTGDVGGTLDEGVGDVEDTVLLEAETVAASGASRAFKGGPVNNVLEVGAGELEELLKDGRRLCLIQRSHLIIPDVKMKQSMF